MSESNAQSQLAMRVIKKVCQQWSAGVTVVIQDLDQMQKWC